MKMDRFNDFDGRLEHRERPEREDEEKPVSASLDVPGAENAPVGLVSAANAILRQNLHMLKKDFVF